MLASVGVHRRYFGQAANTSKGYCGNGKQMLLCFILHGAHYSKHATYCYVINNPVDKSAAFCMPVAVVRFGATFPTFITPPPTVQSNPEEDALGVAEADDQTPVSTQCRFRWHWEQDGGSFEPYTDAVNTHIERAYDQSKRLGQAVVRTPQIRRCVPFAAEIPCPPIRRALNIAVVVVCRLIHFHSNTPRYRHPFVFSDGVCLTDACCCSTLDRLRYNNDQLQDYDIDFGSGLQINAATKYRRRINRREVEVLLTGNESWCYQAGNGAWRRFDSMAQDPMRAAYTQYATGRGPSEMDLSFPGSPDTYRLNFADNSQTNSRTGVRRSIALRN
jgi:hypothetical protein